MDRNKIKPTPIRFRASKTEAASRLKHLPPRWRKLVDDCVKAFSEAMKRQPR